MLGMRLDDPAYTTGNIIETIHPDDRLAYREAIVVHFRGDTPRFEVDFRFKSADGSWRWCRQYGVAVRHPDGRAYRIVGVMSDVTEERQRNRELETARAEAAAAYRQGDTAADPLTSNEERYALAMESINYGLYDWNLENDTIYFAPGLRIQLGLTSAVLSKPSDWRERMHPSDWPVYRRKLVEHLKGETPRLTCDVRYRTEDGTWRWARQHGIACRGLDGRARRMVGVAGDITETRQRERQLDTARAEAAAAHRDVEQTREMLQTIIDNMTDGVSLFDKDMRWLFSNRPHMRTMGYTPETLRPGMPIEEMIRLHASRGEYGPDDIEALVKEGVARVCAPSGTRYERRMQNGRFIEFNFKPLSDGGMLGVYRDITELKEREEALAAAKEAAERARDTAERARAEAAETRNEIERTREIM